MKYYYSVNPKGFFRDDMPQVITDNGLDITDLVELDEHEYNMLFNPPDGMYMVFDDNGPRLEFLPKPDYIAIAEKERDVLLAEVQSSTYTLNMKLNLGRISDEEKAVLNEWLDYADALSALDLSTAPNIDWPTKPQV